MLQDAQIAPTYFAPAERAAPEHLRLQAEAAQADPLLKAISLCIDGVLMILNRQRQVLAVNHELLQALGIPDVGCLIGMRPGEVLRCVHAWEGPGGCGTSRACASCGAVIAILASQREGMPSEGECLATVQRDGHPEALELHVRATPVQCGGDELTVFVLTDVSAVKRRAALEHLFFHDILNTIGGLRIWTSVLEKGGATRMQTAAAEISQLASYLGREVQDQRRLLEAEAGTLALDLQPVPVGDLLEEVQRICRGHAAAEGRMLVVEAPDPDAVIETDRALLRRVLTNMVVNALEAVGEGAVVRVRHQGSGQRHLFRVHNPGEIPPEVAPRIFSRSFSTRGMPGRGLGAYSMKLFGERYLGGRVGFESAPEEGTTFFIRWGPEEEGA